MRPNCYLNNVPFTIFNGSKVTFYAGGANPTRLSYHWYYDPAYQNVAVWDGWRTVLQDGDIPFGRQQTNAAWIKAPTAPGTYYLAWDLVQEGITWYEWKNGTTQKMTVSVSGTPCP